MQYRIRAARQSDLHGIMEVERCTFGEVGLLTMASEELMAERIRLLNSAMQGWFLVAEDVSRMIRGYVILQPTDLDPEHCMSWDMATDGGTLRSTYKFNGRNVYVVSLAADHSSDDGALLLIKAAFERWNIHGGLMMFCSRMPGFLRAHAKNGTEPEKYMRSARSDGSPRDPMLRLYWRVSGEIWPHRLLYNGFPPDLASGGHGAFFALNDPARALCAVNAMLNGGCMEIFPVIQNDDERVSMLQGGRRLWWDVAGQRFVESATVYIPYGCPDWGETGGKRNKLCTFCDLPNAVIGYRDAFYGGRPISTAEHVAMFTATLRQALAESVPHTLMVFNAGSFLAMDAEVQEPVVRAIAHSGVQRLVIESRAERITRDVVRPLAEALRAKGLQLTVRIGVETQDDHLRLRVLRKGHSRRHLVAAVEVLHEFGVFAGGYTLLNPVPGLAPCEAIEECVKTFQFVLGSGEGCLGMDEAYFCSTNVGGPEIRRAWEEGRFAPASLWMVYKTLREGISRHGNRIHLLPFSDVPALIAVPSNHNPKGIPEDLSGAEGCDAAFHRMFAHYRATMNPDVLVPPDCSCRPAWLS